MMATLVEFGKVLRDQRMEHGAAFSGQFDQRSAKVRRVGSAAHQTRALGAVNQLDSAVMSQNHTLGKIGDGRFLACGKGFDNLHQLVLLRRHTRGLTNGFAETEEPAKLIAKLRKLFKANHS